MTITTTTGINAPLLTINNIPVTPAVIKAITDIKDLRDALTRCCLIHAYGHADEHTLDVLDALDSHGGTRPTDDVPVLRACAEAGLPAPYKLRPLPLRLSKTIVEMDNWLDVYNLDNIAVDHDAAMALLTDILMNEYGLNERAAHGVLYDGYDAGEDYVTYDLEYVPRDLIDKYGPDGVDPDTIRRHFVNDLGQIDIDEIYEYDRDGCGTWEIVDGYDRQLDDYKPLGNYTFCGSENEFWQDCDLDVNDHWRVRLMVGDTDILTEYMTLGDKLDILDAQGRLDYQAYYDGAPLFDDSSSDFDNEARAVEGFYRDNAENWSDGKELGLCVYVNNGTDEQPDYDYIGHYTYDPETDDWSDFED